MDCKSWPVASWPRFHVFRTHLGGHSEPSVYPVKVTRLVRNESISEKNADESPERPSKTSRTIQSHSNNCSRVSEPLSTAEADKPSVAHINPPDNTRVSSELDAQAASPQPVSSRTDTEARMIQKKKWEETEEIQPKRRKTEKTSEDPLHHTSEAPSTDKSSTSSSETAARPDTRDEFSAKYTRIEFIGDGGFGSVFAGYRKSDNLPVAIKYVRQDGVRRISTDVGGRLEMVPIEVVLMLALNPTGAESGAAVALLDWYDLRNELILILERPVPCVDLADLVFARDDPMEEDEAKVIARQLVDALIEIQSKGVFHRDIKPSNILIETGSSVPRVRIIDFGCGMFQTQSAYRTQQGTLYLSYSQSQSSSFGVSASLNL